MSIPERKSMLYYWSIRYFTILCISIAILGALTLYVFYKSDLSNQMRSLEKAARDLGSIAANNGGKIPEVPNMEQALVDLAARYDLKDKPVLFLLDRNGTTIQQFPEIPPQETRHIADRLAEVMSKGAHTFQLDGEDGREPLLVGVYPIDIESSEARYALYVAPRHNVMDRIAALRYPRFFLVASFLLIGWVIIYVLTRRLIQPIQEVADAVQQIVAGDYNLHLNKTYKEKEIDELTRSFKEMADRLHRLESLRTQLLAGVTHEFKTPVTSISGLVQAVRQKVVRGKEADVFLDHCLNECNRLQKMVEDLLDFNSFASGTMKVSKESVNLQEVLAAIVARWRCSQEQLMADVSFETAATETHVYAYTDPTRLEQIVINLLNNARDAIAVDGKVVVRLASDSGQYRIQVQDTGRGIPAEEQKDVFEPFYRGMEKKAHVHGLGLGLPFSRIIARSLGGDLLLTSSSTGGTIFELTIPLPPEDKRQSLT